MKAKTDKILDLESKIKDLQQLHGNFPSSCTDDDRSKAIVAHIKKVIVRSIKNHAYTSHRSDSFFKILCDMLLYEDIHNFKLRDRLLEVLRLYMRQNVLTPFRILKEMDLAGGVLNYGGIEILRRCETNGTKHQRTMFPSAGSIKKMAAIVEEYRNEIIPYKIIRNSNDGAEGFYCRPADMIRECVT